MTVKQKPNGTTIVSTVFTGRMADLINGKLTVRDLDDEELARGTCRDHNGRFSARAALVPREFQQEMIRRLLERGDELWREGFNIAIRTHLEIASDLNVDPSTRLKAAQYIIERVSGKTPDRLLITADDAIETLFRQLLTHPDGLEAPVLDAEVVEDAVAVG